MCIITNNEKNNEQKQGMAINNVISIQKYIVTGFL